eukprot:gene10715-11862_t
MAATDHTNHPNKNSPKDALAMASILKEMGVSEYEPRLINQMLEFSYRYITDVLEDARVYSLHASKKHIDQADVVLAVERRMDHSFTSAPPREFLLEVARNKNAQPLPLIQDKSGLRLPPDRYCLTGNNYRLKTGNLSQRKIASQRLTNTVSTSKLLTNQSSIGSSVIKPALSRGATAVMNIGKLKQGSIGPVLQTTSQAMEKKNLVETTAPTHSVSDMKTVRVKTEPPETSSTVASLPSMEETAASAHNQNFPNLLKRKREEEQECINP